jgi:hypothetical protein
VSRPKQNGSIIVTDQESHDLAGTLSVRDMQDWLRQEVRDSAKAHELRIRGATEFVTAYADGRVTTEQAMEALVRHDRRWGEALYGASAIEGKSDEAILNAIDKAREKEIGRHVDRAAKRMRRSTETSI